MEVYSFGLNILILTRLPYSRPSLDSPAQIVLLEYFSRDQRRRVAMEIVFSNQVHHHQNLLDRVPFPRILIIYWNVLVVDYQIPFSLLELMLCKRFRRMSRG